MKKTKIGLIDVDGHNFPNLPLMKISAYHKKIGDNVEFAIPMLTYDIVYQSKIFTDSPDFNTCLKAKEVIYGGSGYDLKNKLPVEIENIYPDYDLYKTKIAYGFLTRGCPRNCPFCIVGQKEGFKSYKVADLDSFWNGQKEIKLLDPNLTACKENKYELLQQLADSKAYVDFTQGLDIRLMDSKTIDLLLKIKLKTVRFAWDRDNDSDLIVKNLKEFKKATNIDERNARVYVLVNYETNFEFDLYRIYKLKKLGYDPFVMIFDKKHASKKIKHLARWVNKKDIFWTCERFEDYNPHCFRKRKIYGKKSKNQHKQMIWSDVKGVSNEQRKNI